MKNVKNTSITKPDWENTSVIGINKEIPHNSAIPQDSLEGALRYEHESTSSY